MLPAGRRRLAAPTGAAGAAAARACWLPSRPPRAPPPQPPLSGWLPPSAPGRLRRRDTRCANRFRELEADTLPGGAPNTLNRRLTYWAAHCYAPRELLALLREHGAKGGEFKPRHAAAVLMRLPTLLFHRLPSTGGGAAAAADDLVAVLAALPPWAGDEPTVRLLEGAKLCQLLAVCGRLGAPPAGAALRAWVRELCRGGGAKLRQATPETLAAAAWGLAALRTTAAAAAAAERGAPGGGRGGRLLRRMLSARLPSRLALAPEAAAAAGGEAAAVAAAAGDAAAWRDIRLAACLSLQPTFTGASGPDGEPHAGWALSDVALMASAAVAMAAADAAEAGGGGTGGGPAAPEDGGDGLMAALAAAARGRVAAALAHRAAAAVAPPPRMTAAAAAFGVDVRQPDTAAVADALAAFAAAGLRDDALFSGAARLLAGCGAGGSRPPLEHVCAGLEALAAADVAEPSFLRAAAARIAAAVEGAAGGERLAPAAAANALWALASLGGADAALAERVLASLGATAAAPPASQAAAAPAVLRLTRRGAPPAAAAPSPVAAPDAAPSPALRRLTTLRLARLLWAAHRAGADAYAPGLARALSQRLAAAPDPGAERLVRGLLPPAE